MKKYNLTFWQKFTLPLIYLMWYFHADRENRKSWHLVKKGMEKHKCNFIVPYKCKGFDFLQCDHEGCNTCIPVDDLEIKITKRNDNY